MSLIWELPCKSQEFMKLPSLAQHGNGLRLTFDYETDNGYKESTVYFEGIEAFSFTHYEACTPEQVGAYDKVVVVAASTWLEELRERKVSDDGRSLHYRVFFDEVGCYDVIAKGFAPPC